MLEVDGKSMGQMNAIAIYLGNEFGKHTFQFSFI